MSTGPSHSPEGSVGLAEPPKEEKKLRVVITSLDQNVDAFAREAAHEKLSNQHEGPIWKRIAKSAWGNISREYQVVKATQEARQEILDSGNLLHHQGKSDEQWREATKMRYSSEFGEQLIHDGETFHKLNSPEAATDPNAEEMVRDIGDLHRRAARGEFVDDASLEEQIVRMRQKWREGKLSQAYIGEGQFLASNLAESCRELEGMINSAAGLSAVEKEALIDAEIAKMEVIAGEARVGSRTEIDSTLSERIAEKLKHVPLGKVLGEKNIARVTAALGNETTVAAMMSVGIYGAKRGMSIASKIIAPGIGSGIVAAIRERNALMDERNLEERRADAGGDAAEVPDDTDLSTTRKLLKKIGIGKSAEEYRAELNATQYESRPAGELLDELSNFYDASGDLAIHDRASMDRAMAKMGEIRARIKIGDRKGARLINFADISPEEMEMRRFDLDLAMAKFETDMKKMMENPIAKAMLNIKPEEDFEGSFVNQCEVAEGMLMGEMKAKDRLFNKIVAKRAFKRAVMRTFMGAAVGGVMTYGADAARDVYHTIQGAFDGLGAQDATSPAMGFAAYETGGSGGGATEPGYVGSDGPSHVGGDTPNHVGSSTPNHVGSDTPNHVGSSNPDHVGSDAIPNHVGSDLPGHVGGGPEGAGVSESVSISDSSKINLPEGYKVETGSKGTITIVSPDGKEYAGLTLTHDGSLSDASLETLKANGFSVSDQSEVISGAPTITHEAVSPNQFYENHKDTMKVVHRTGWVKGPNELRLVNSVNSNGDVVVSIQGMHNVDFSEARLGVSVGHGMQGRVMELRFKADGTLVIPKGADIHSMFGPDGQFKGTGFEEVFMSNGQAPGGGENITVLATEVGNGDTKIQDTISTPTLKTAHTYTFSAPSPNMNPAASATATGVGAATATGRGYVPFTGSSTTRRRTGRAGSPPPTAGTTFTPPPSSSGPGFGLGGAPSAGSGGPSAAPGSAGTGGPGPSGPEAASGGISGGSTAGAGGSATGPEAGSSTSSTSSAGGPEAGKTGSTTTGTGTGPEASTAAPSGGTASGGSGSGPEGAPGGLSSGASGTEAGGSSSTGSSTGAESGSASATAGAGAGTAGGPEASGTSAGTAGSSTGPEASATGSATGTGTAGPEASTTPNPEEAKFMADLDAETLAFPDGYDFPGMARGFTERERKLASRFIRQAESELGGTDRMAVNARASELLKAEAAGKAGPLSGLYTRVTGLMDQSAEQLRRRSGREEKAKAKASADPKDFLTDLDSGTERFPYSSFVNPKIRLSQHEKRLVARIYEAAAAEIAANRGAMPPDPTSTSTKDEIVAYNKYMSDLFRRAKRMAHIDAASSLTREQQLLFAAASGVFSDVAPRLKVKVPGD